MKSQQVALVPKVQGYVSSIRSQRQLQLGGNACSPLNRDILSRCVEAWLYLIEDLMVRQSLTESARDDRRDNFMSVILRADFVETLSALDVVYTCLIEDRYSRIDEFKAYLDMTISQGVDWRRLISPVNLLVYSFLSETNQEQKAHFLSSIAQFLRFPRKLEFQDIGLEAKALEGYKETEDELEAMVYDDEPMLTGIERIIQAWFGDFHIDNLRPAHGPGSVAEGPLTLAQKFKSMTVDSKVKILLRNHSEPESYLGYFPVPPVDGLVRCSRTVFVPKTATKLRTISMEPATLQYLQQGVMYEIYRYIDRHPFLGARVRLRDQDQNQVLAWEGSKYHHYGTIDLSHASDSVSWDLVRRVFRSVPHLYKWFLGTRSSETILPDGERLQLKKFAPMGSALCFPVECIIFAAIVEYASSKTCRRLKIPKRIYSVYGDDLVVQSECYDETIKCLTACGFTVNTTKSYNHGEYRESCGKEYYAGVDISALYYRIPFYSKRVTPAAYGSMCSCANNAYLHSLPIFRSYLIDKINGTFRRKPYFTFTPEASPFLYSPTPTNFGTKIRWNSNYQRKEGRFVVVKSKRRNGEFTEEDDTLSYFCRLVEMSKRPTGSSDQVDEPPLPYAMHGSVEFFSSTVLPVPYYTIHQLNRAEDWSG